MNRSVIGILLLGMLGGMLAGCRFFESNEEEASAELVGTVWDLVAVETLDGAPILTPEPPGAYRLYFHDGTCAESQNACNSCFGTYRAYEEGQLGLAQACTEIACDSEVYNYTDTYSIALSNAALYWIDRDLLSVRVRMDGVDRVLVHKANSEAEPLRTYCETDEEEEG